MKLSEINNDKMLDILIEVTPFISDILEDENIVNTFNEKVVLPKGLKKDDREKYLFKQGLKKFIKLLPYLIKNHREAIYKTWAMLNDISYDDVVNQKITTTFWQINNFLNDEDLTNFLQYQDK